LTGKLITGSRLLQRSWFFAENVLPATTIFPRISREELEMILPDSSDTSYAVGDDFQLSSEKSQNKAVDITLASSLRMTPGFGRSGCAAAAGLEILTSMPNVLK
jgi:hypothetical protein